MLLGDLIARFGDGGTTEEAILGLDDLALLAELRARADACGLDLGSYAAAAISRYGSGASDEEWITLIGAMGRAGDPGAIYLKRALAYVTEAKARRPPCGGSPPTRTGRASPCSGQELPDVSERVPRHR